ncbi:MAG: recombinase family protein [Bdellovibrionota bacterium]
MTGTKVAVYVRVSTVDKQSTESQRLAIESYSTARGLGSAATYEDKISGMKRNRPALDKLIEDCKSGQVKTVIVFSFSRMGRSLKHLIELLEFFNAHKIAFISVSEQFDTSTSSGRVMFAIISALGQWEREQISERTKAGLAVAKAAGKQIGAKKKYDNPEMFAEFRKKGLSIRTIAKVLKCSPATVIKNLKQSVQLTGA